MARVLYYRRIRPSPPEPNTSSSPASRRSRGQTPPTARVNSPPPLMPTTTTSSSSPATLDDPNSPSSPLPDPGHELFYYESDIDRYSPDTPEQDWDDSSFDYAEEANFDAFVCLRDCVDEFAISALEHYNKEQEQIKDGISKYELVEPIISWRVMDEGSYYHLNFTAKRSLEENPEEEFFFAEVLYDCDTGGWVPTCIISMEEDEGVSGIQYSVHDGGADPRRC